MSSVANRTSARVLARTRGWRQEVIDFACRLVATDSSNPPGDERAVTEHVVSEARQLGLQDIDIVAKEPHRPNVIIRVSGRSGGPTLMYDGHLDTKPVGDRSKWRTDPFEPTVRNNSLFGLGACDMKGAVAALLYATAAINELSEDLAGDLLLVLTADEEAGGVYGAEYLAEEVPLTADIGLIAEPSGITSDLENFCLVSRGEFCFKTKVYGTQMHSSMSDMIPSVSATLKMAEILPRFRRELTFKHDPHRYCSQGITVNPGVLVSGGVYYGVLPGYAEFGTEVRVLPGMTLDSVRRDLDEFVEQLRQEDPQLELEVEFEQPPLRWIEPVEVSGEEPFVQVALTSAEEVLGFRPQLNCFPAWTDARFFNHKMGIPTISAFGPGLLPVAHGPNEFIRVESIVQAAQIYALAAWHYLRSQ